jgi:hypothetical protein
MSKLKQGDKGSLRPEYTQADFPGGMVRGRFAKRTAAGSNIVVLDPDLASAFPDSAAVNEALRTVLKAARRVAAAAE